MAGGRGNVARFQRDLKAMVDEWGRETVSVAVMDLALDVRDEAEENSRRRLKSVPGEPDIADGWFAGPVLMDQDWPPEQGGSRAVSEARLRNMKPGDSIYVYNSVFYAYFHEKGYNHVAGKTVPGKSMLQDALASVGGRVVKV